MCFCHDKCFPLRMRYVNATADFESYIKEPSTPRKVAPNPTNAVNRKITAVTKR